MTLALVHDWLNQVGGAEDVLATLVGLYPASPVYTSIYAPDLMPASYRAWDIRPLWLDRLPAIHSHHQPYLPLYPLAWGGLDLSRHEVILSNKSGFCHGVRHGSQTIHICYCLAPTRYVWQLDAYVAREGLGALAQAGLRPLMAALRRWDYAAAQRVTHFIAISTEIRQRIARYYGRESVIIYPPVDTARFQPSATVEDYFLVVSRLIPYKRIDLAVQAATRLGVPLKVAGRGRDLEQLRALAGPTVEFLGYVPDDALPDLMARCKAFIFPGLEDFGITPVQAQAAGRPVIAYGGGGALDTVLPGVTGEHFTQPTVEALMAVMAGFDAGRYRPARLRAHAERFDSGVFSAQITSFVEQAQAVFQQQRPFVWHNPVQL
ncbi:MAG: glycosyl transferase [Chloroflexota bacterium]|nr:MAG: glycosyl transferase [Chloroflexota bacterium]